MSRLRASKAPRARPREGWVRGNDDRGADALECFANAVFRLHSRLRPPSASRLSRSGSRERKGARADRRDLPAALAGARRPRDASLSGNVGRDLARGAARPRRLPRAVEDSGAPRRAAQPQGPGSRGGRHGRHGGRRRRRRGEAHARVHGRRVALDRRRRSRRRRPVLVAAGRNRALRHRDRGGGDGRGDLFRDRGPRGEAGDRGADVGRLRREFRRPRRAPVGSEFVCQRRDRRQH